MRSSLSLGLSLGWRLALVFALQALALLYMVADRQWTLTTGTPLVLDTTPIDPRSLFGGDYVRLNYKISRLSLEQIGGDRGFRQHDPIYVLLRRGEPVGGVVSVHKTGLTPSPEHVILRGDVVESGMRSWDPESGKPVVGEYVRVRYGIESYFVPEGEGRAIERPVPEEKISIRVAIDARGRAAIQALLVNGQERYVEKLF